MVELLIASVLGYFLLTYWMVNPDGRDTACYANADLVPNYLIIKEGDAEVSAYTVNVTKKFETFFAWGFVAQIIVAFICMMRLGALLIDNEAFAVLLAQASAVIKYCGGFPWLIYGGVVRWGQAGRICSNTIDTIPRDGTGLLTQSGQFIKNLTLILSSLVAAVCLLVITLVACRIKKA